MPTIRHVCVLTACIALISACEDSTDTSDNTITYTAQLSGANEVPANQTTGTGFFTAQLNPTSGTLSYSVTWTGLTARATAAHIHGPADATQIANPIVDFATPPPGTTNAATVNLAGGPTVGTQTGGSASGNLDVKLAMTATVSGDSLVKLLDAGMAYVNVHTPLNGGGEIRGQITRQQ